MEATRFAEENGFKYPCVAGSVHRENGESVYCWAVFNRKDVSQAEIDLHNDSSEENEFDLGFELTSWEEFSNGVGRWFGRAPRTIIGRNRILVIQFRAMDI